MRIILGTATLVAIIAARFQSGHSVREYLLPHRGTGVLTEITLPDPAARPRRLAITADGLIWYTDYSRGYLGRYDPRTRETREWKAPDNNSGPYAIGIAPDGKIWFNESGANAMVVFDPASTLARAERHQSHRQD